MMLRESSSIQRGAGAESIISWPEYSPIADSVEIVSSHEKL